MKKIVAILAFVLSVMSVGMVDSFAISLNEIEELATGMDLNVPITDSLETEGSENWYKFEMNERGYYRFQLKLTDNTDINSLTDGWSISIYNKKDIVNAVKTYEYVKNEFKSQKMALEPGIYYIRIIAQKKSAEIVGCEYAVESQFVPDNIWEFENNDTQETANLIETNKIYNGQLLCKQDVDWYKVECKENAILTMNFLFNDDTDTAYIQNGWHVYFYNKDMELIAEFYNVKSEILMKERSFDAGVYYLKVEGDVNRAPVDCTYSVKVNYEVANDWESENNGTESRADEIEINLTYKATLHERTDIDWYKVKIKDTGYFKVEFQVDENTNKENIHNGWKISVLDKNLNLIKQYEAVKDNFISAELPYQTGDYYVKVEPSWNSFDYNVPIDCIYSVCVVSKVSDSWEIEQNSDISSANEITINKTYNGTLHGQFEIDWYKVNVDKKGYFKLQFNVDENVNAESINNGWKVSVLDEQQNVIKEYTAVKNSFESGVLPYQIGNYYVKVEPSWNTWDSNVPIDCIHSVCVATKASNNWEIEGTNDTSSVAATATNKTVQGTLYKNKDVDWYKFNISNTGYFQLKFDIDKNVVKENIKQGWKITIFDKNLNEIKKYQNVTKKVTSGAIPYPKGTYYVKVETQNDYGNNAPVDCIYSVHMVSRASSSFETENNNEKSKADTISVNKEYHGILTNATDEDWYKFTVPSNGKVLLKFSKHSTVASSTVGFGWNVEIYQGTKLIQKYETVKTSFKYTADLKKGTYYVKVKAQSTYGTNSPLDRRYSVKVSFTAKPAASSIKTISTKSKTVTLSWYQSSKATGYYVYRATTKNATYRKIATIKNKATVKYTDKNNLKKGTRYYYKIVAYNNSNGLTVSATAGAVKSIQVK